MSEGQQEGVKGDVSDWNEGNFKSMRLHQAQNFINFGKVNPLKKIFLDSNNKTNWKWGYELWYDGIHIMEGEGNQLYNPNESKEVKKLKEGVKELMKIPVSRYISNYSNSGIIVYPELWKELEKKLEEFEYLVKKLNSKHGLATKLQGTKGLF